MIRAIAAIDDHLGLATEDGIPWKVPADVEHFRRATAGGSLLMGFGTYVELDRPLPGRASYVATRRDVALREGFTRIGDVDAFLTDWSATDQGRDLWVIGGASLFSATLDRIEELVLTRVEGDFACTKFFPPFEAMFRLVSDTPLGGADGTPAIRFQTWRRSAPVR